MLSDNDIYLASITCVEMAAAIARRLRAGTLSSGTAAMIGSQFRSEAQGGYLLVHLTPDVLERAVQAAQRHALRGYDAVQLASALEMAAVAGQAAQSLTFVTADHELLAAAAAEGLAVEDPNAHP